MALDFVQRCLELANAHIRTLSKHRDFVPAERSLYFLFPWQEWWRLKKNEASRREGRRVWAWELDPPTGHGCWVLASQHAILHSLLPRGTGQVTLFC
jgi:hypothetical protein